MFKVGQKVVFIGISVNPIKPGDIVNIPKKGEIVKISGLYKEMGVLRGYLLEGREFMYRENTKRYQVFQSDELAPIQPAHEINTAAIAKELVLTPERLDAPTPVQKPVHEPSEV